MLSLRVSDMHKTKGQRDCPLCKGSGRMSNPAKDATVMCDCVIKSFALEYLGPLYQSSTYKKTMDLTKVLEPYLVCLEDSLDQFKMLVKSFLLGTNMKYQHLSCTAYEVIQAYLSKTDVVSFTMADILNVDVLFLYLNGDPKNAGYAEIIPFVVEQRALNKRRTWIFSRDSISENKFSDKYGVNITPLVAKYGKRFK